jgi:Zn ribbon nucleic-acid-binding protein
MGCPACKRQPELSWSENKCELTAAGIGAAALRYDKKLKKEERRRLI